MSHPIRGYSVVVFEESFDESAAFLTNENTPHFERILRSANFEK
jgi:hypothetical protein